MVVDDEPMNIAVMEALFEELNVKCDSASGGSDAITLARDRLNKVKQGQAEMYRFIFLDYSMPYIDGPGVAI